VKDASLKASPSLNGVVIETKLFSRPKKDKDLRAKSKAEVEKLKGKYAKTFWEYGLRMINKLVSILDGKTSQGVKHKFGDEIISKGVKFN
jgi:DNA-directed RNA polymerase subunit beta